MATVFITKADKLYKKAAQLEEEADELMLKAIEQKARKILARRPKLNEFIMGMGVWFFTSKDNPSARFDDQNTGYLKSIGSIINNGRKPTGYPMRFTSMGPKATEW